MNKKLESAAEIKTFAEKLKQYECVYKFDSVDEPEAWRLAHSLSDLEKTFKEILENYLPALYEADGEEAVHDALLDIGEELRHILYHIKDTRFFSYLSDE